MLVPLAEKWRKIKARGGAVVGIICSSDFRWMRGAARSVIFAKREERGDVKDNGQCHPTLLLDLVTRSLEAHIALHRRYGGASTETRRFTLHRIQLLR